VISPKTHRIWSGCAIVVKKLRDLAHF
jgi:hypothetical protein